MQVEVSFAEMPSQKSEVTRKQSDAQSGGTLQPAVQAAAAGRGFSSLTQSLSPATSFSQPRKNEHCCFRSSVQIASWPRKQASYGFDQLTAEGKKRGAWVVKS